MRAYVLDDQRPVSTGDLAAIGVLHWTLPTDEESRAAAVERIKRERGYVDHDVVALVGNHPDYATICAKFDREHSHSLDEARFVIEGEGVFDVRGRRDEWVRIEVSAGDLIIIPPRKFHRFLMTDRRFIRCVRLFADHSGWTPDYRGTDHNAEEVAQ